MVRLARALWVLITLSLVGILGAAPVAATEETNVTLCHATNSLTNPFVEITISVNGLNGHRIGEDFHVNAKTGLQDFLLEDSDLETCDEVPEEPAPFVIEVDHECGALSARILDNNTEFPAFLSAVIGENPLIADYPWAETALAVDVPEGTTLALDFEEDEFGGSVTITILAHGPEQDVYAVDGRSSVFETITVDTDCVSPTPTPSPSPSQSVATQTPAPSQSMATASPSQTVAEAIPNTAMETPTGNGFWISLLIAALVGATVFYGWMRLGSPRKR